MIYIIGLGPNDSSNIKENIKQLLLNNTNAKVIARTKEHPAISFLEENNIKFETIDFIQKVKISKILITV